MTLVYVGVTVTGVDAKVRVPAYIPMSCSPNSSRTISLPRSW